MVLFSIIQGKPNCVAIICRANLDFSIPSFLDILTYDPRGIIEAVDDIFQTVEDLTIGVRGKVTQFKVDFIGRALQNTLGAGTGNNFIAQARRAVIGTLDDKLNSYAGDDVVAGVLNDLLVLGPSGVKRSFTTTPVSA